MVRLWDKSNNNNDNNYMPNLLQYMENKYRGASLRNLEAVHILTMIFLQIRSNRFFFLLSRKHLKNIKI